MYIELTVSVLIDESGKYEGFLTSYRTYQVVGTLQIVESFIAGWAGKEGYNGYTVENVLLFDQGELKKFDRRR
jgi:hypothetical protein